MSTEYTLFIPPSPNFAYMFRIFKIIVVPREIDYYKIWGGGGGGGETYIMDNPKVVNSVHLHDYLGTKL